MKKRRRKRKMRREQKREWRVILICGDREPKERDLCLNDGQSIQMERQRLLISSPLEAREEVCWAPSSGQRGLEVELASG